MRYVSFRRTSGIASFGRLEGDEIVLDRIEMEVA